MIDENENNHNNTELTVEERRRLDALSREMTPPPELEDQTIQTLARSGLLARRPRWWVGVSALVASVLIFLPRVADDERRSLPRRAHRR